MKTVLTSLCLMIAAPLSAQGLMTAEEFDRFTRGKTFYYGVDGQSYGAEEYLPNQSVIWTFLDGRCQNGIWYQEGEMICFEYDRLPERQCWTFRESTSGGLVARFQDDPKELELYEVQRSSESLICPGPDVGV